MSTVARVLAHTVLWGMPLFGVFLYFHPHWNLETLTHSFSLAMILGIFAYGFILQQFILAARVKILDRIFGHDRVMRLHGFLGILVLMTLTGHIIFKNLNTYSLNVQVALGVGSGLLFTAIILLSAFFMSPILLAKWKPIDAFCRWSASKLRLQYQNLRTIHNFMALAAALAAIHVFLASATSETWVRRGYMGGLFVLAMVAYFYHKVVKPWRLRAQPFVVEAVKVEAPGITTVTMGLPHGRIFEHRPGQFAFFRFFQKGFPNDEHPFTLSSAPNRSTISLTAKNLGDFSGALTRLLPGAHVSVDGPYGLFQLPKIPDGRPLVFLAGGIGITPFLSMLRGLGGDNPPATIQLIWNTKTVAELFAKDELERLAQKIPGFRWTALVSREKAPGIPQGRLDPTTLDRLGTVPDAHYYLCGPDGQMQVLVRYLLKKGVCSQHLHFERFSF